MRANNTRRNHSLRTERLDRTPVQESLRIMLDSAIKLRTLDLPANTTPDVRSDAGTADSQLYQLELVFVPLYWRAAIYFQRFCKLR